MRLRDGEDVDLDEGELIVIPRGVEHCPVALTDSCDVLLLERAETLNTGTADVGDHVHEKSKRGAYWALTMCPRVSCSKN